ncbi:Ff.00g071470.m01.CDS01 [Fusarium sp. VM40]|nr:Ff.00g071470.m01.CDS01 [Fusarium sp. VM40]
MAQGTVKKLGRPTPAKITHSKRQASKVHKPKTTKASIDKVHKKFTSGLTARTEALLGERAGHLELLGQKKKKADQKKDGKRPDKRTTIKGGSKKFG